MTWLIGVVVGLGCALLGYALHGGNIAVLWQPTEVLSIVGLAVGYLIAGNSGRNLKATMAALPRAFKSPSTNKRKCLDLLCLLFEVLQKIRRDGLMSLEADIEEPEASPLFEKYPSIAKDHHLTEFICDYLRMMLGGSLNIQQVEALMEQELETHHQEAHVPVTVIAKMADAFPAFGIVAAVMGVVMVMGSIGLPPAELGKLINETWFKAEKEGVYYGQCSELCGSRHAFMPITVRVVSEKQYNEWLKEAKAKFAKYPENNVIAENLIKEKK